VHTLRNQVEVLGSVMSSPIGVRLKTDFVVFQASQNASH